MKDREKITLSCGDLYRQVETVAKSYVEKETNIKIVQEELIEQFKQVNERIADIQKETLYNRLERG